MTWDDKVQRALAMGAYNPNYLPMRMLKESEDMQNEIERRKAYEIKPATLGEIAKLFIETEGAIPLQCVPFIFTERRTDTSRVLMMPQGMNPEDLSADELDTLWGQFQSKQ